MGRYFSHKVVLVVVNHSFAESNFCRRERGLLRATGLVMKRDLECRGRSSSIKKRTTTKLGIRSSNTGT